ncbi:hypothetical protein [Mycoplasma procyoni]|uniref:hypothetical protein n=1 Tax=Mycoplasma procyoni TaxID=568784 RepID=UPI00197B317E|nr:hypothetical protein [Mycoplasma procyoni]MBN3534939.1 hypothetical protein [Mycoplasma procyoni]
MNKVLLRFGTTIKRNTVLIYTLLLIAMISNTILFFLSIYGKDPVLRLTMTENILYFWAPYLVLISTTIWNLSFLWRIYKIFDIDNPEEKDVIKANKLFKFLFLIGYWGTKSQQKVETKTEKQIKKLKKISNVNPWITWFFPLYWALL